jgi:hypothetical protein
MQLVQTLGRASLYRKESFNGRITPLVEWVVKVGEQTVRECRTRKDALVWLGIYRT